MAALREEVRQADLAFAEALAEHDRTAFLGFIADSTAFHGASGIQTDPEQVAAAWDPLLDPSSGSSLSWRPDTVEVSASADLAYTLGSYEITTTSDDGSKSYSRGRYVSVWKRSDNGAWKVAVDIGTPPQPHEEEPQG